MFYTAFVGLVLAWIYTKTRKVRYPILIHMGVNFFGGIVMLMTCLFQASGKAVPAMILSLSRQGIVFLLVLLLAVRIAGYSGILVSQCAADLLSAALALALYAGTRLPE